ncbi:MAG TPA: arsenate reductase (glutaredoxin) [Phaeodactylibacter sp.]|nr:arsenate reductase (glutaredoxin) [Phaeodactylibacter sp.]
MKIYHNPRCSKSRQTLALLHEKGLKPEVVLYLEETPTEKELTTLIKKLGIKPKDLIRKGEAIYKEKYKGKELSDKEWIAAMLAHPKLIERPIVVKGKKAVLGRPPENVLDLL